MVGGANSSADKDSVAAILMSFVIAGLPPWRPDSGRSPAWPHYGERHGDGNGRDGPARLVYCGRGGRQELGRAAGLLIVVADKALGLRGCVGAQVLVPAVSDGLEEQFGADRHRACPV